MERDLCIGGVEISNPCRTWAYLTRIGNRCFNGGAGPCCPGVAWHPGAYANIQAAQMTGPDRWSIKLVDVVPGLSVVSRRRMTVGVSDVADGPCPPVTQFPLPEDPDWVEIDISGPVDATPEYELFTAAIGDGTGVQVCTLDEFVLSFNGQAFGTLWVSSSINGTAAPMFSWQHVTETMPWWGPAGFVAVQPVVYTTPEQDFAPWYDPADPHSKDVLGVWIDDIVVGRPHSRTSQSRQHGGALSSTRYGAREITIGGRIYVRTKAAGHYAQRWLYEALVGSPCNDTGCSLPTLQLTQWYDPVDPDAGIVYAHEVGLTDWQAVLDTTEPSDCFVSFTATLSAQIPWLTRKPRHITTQQLVQGDPFCDYCGNTTASGTCEEIEEENVLLACGCGDNPPMPLMIQNNECYVRPIWVSRHFVEVNSPAQWADGALRITVHGGEDWDPSSPSVKNLRFRVYHDPDGHGAAAGDDFICSAEPCADVSIGCVPYGSDLIIDGAMRRGWVEHDGVERSADPYLSSNGGAIIWPEFSCGSLVVAIDVDMMATASDSTFTIETVEIQRA